MFRLKDEEVVCIKIYANGEKFDVGGGSKQFGSIDDLILHYKKYPLKTNKGDDIHLNQVNYSCIASCYSYVTFIVFYRELILTVLHKVAQGITVQ